VDVLLVLLLGDEVGLVLGEPSSDGPGLLVTEVEGKVCRAQESWSARSVPRLNQKICGTGHTLGVLALVQFPNVLPLLLVDDGQDSGDGLSDTVATREMKHKVSFNALPYRWGHGRSGRYR
jgi:hypothetical protein